MKTLLSICLLVLISCAQYAHAQGYVANLDAKALWEDAEMLKKRTATTPLRRIGEPDEIAGAAVFLAGRAGSFTTGQTIVIDGGVTI